MGGLCLCRSFVLVDVLSLAYFPDTSYCYLWFTGGKHKRLESAFSRGVPAAQLSISLASACYSCRSDLPVVTNKRRPPPTAIVKPYPRAICGHANSRSFNGDYDKYDNLLIAPAVSFSRRKCAVERTDTPGNGAQLKLMPLLSTLDVSFPLTSTTERENYQKVASHTFVLRWRWNVKWTFRHDLCVCVCGGVFPVFLCAFVTKVDVLARSSHTAFPSGSRDPWDPAL